MKKLMKSDFLRQKAQKKIFQLFFHFFNINWIVLVITSVEGVFLGPGWGAAARLLFCVPEFPVWF